MKADVCVIDGDPAVRDSLATLIQLRGHEVCTFSTGAAFLHGLEPESLKCVVCEAELPDMTGVSVYQTLERRNVNAPFALLVSRNEQSTVTAAYKAGIRNIFYKPLVHRQLIAFVSGSQSAA